MSNKSLELCEGAGHGPGLAAVGLLLLLSRPSHHKELITHPLHPWELADLSSNLSKCTFKSQEVNFKTLHLNLKSQLVQMSRTQNVNIFMQVCK